MRIFVFGNINSGKSAIVNYLRQYLSDYKIIQIDKYRQEYGDGTELGELTAREKFVKDIKGSDKAIIEFTGYGAIANSLREVLDNKSMLIIYKKASLDVCLERLKYKDFTKIHYPDYGTEISDTIRNLSNVFEDDFIDKFWGEKVFDVLSICEIKELDIQQINKIINKYNQNS